jgi:hypothetical protein
LSGWPMKWLLERDSQLKKLELRKSRQRAGRSAEGQTGISQSGNQREISSSQGSSPPT